MLESLLEEKIKDVSSKNLDRIKEELKVIEKYNKEEFILNLVEIDKSLKNIFRDNYSITGSVNNLYILHVLGVTEFNPIDYDVKISDSFKANINFPEGKIGVLKATLGDVFRENDRYIVMKSEKLTNISRKEDAHNVNNVINIYEKRVLSILYDICSYNNVCFSFNEENRSKLNSLISNNECLHKTVYEEIMDDEDLQDNFGFRYLSELSKEFKLTYIKYKKPTMYYSKVLNYLSKKVDMKVIEKYKGDDEKAISFYLKNGTVNDKDELTYAFYRLLSDAKRVLGRVDLEIVNEKVKLKFYNIIFMEARVRTVTNEICNILIKNLDKKIKLFIYDGTEEWYTNKVISKYMNLDYKGENVVRFLRSPFLENKREGEIDYDKYIAAVNMFRESDIKFYNYGARDYKIHEWTNDIIMNSNHNTDFIIIDNFKYLKEKSYKSMGKLLESFNTLNIPVIVFEFPQNRFRLDREVLKGEIKYYPNKYKWSRSFYGVYEKDKELVVKEICE